MNDCKSYIKYRFNYCFSFLIFFKIHVVYKLFLEKLLSIKCEKF
jgi:hypothetical protein